MSEMRMEWNGLLVHKSVWEPKHPQLTPAHISSDEGRAVQNARPDDTNGNDVGNAWVDPSGTYLFTDLTNWVNA
jgi:hypothetical protein